MNPEIKKQWVEALRSGEYKQTQQKLRDDNGFCCLGVLCDLHAKAGLGHWDENSWYYKCKDSEFMEAKNYLPNPVIQWAVVDSENPSINSARLANLNDDHKSFAEIADLIEANL